jgi:hypothetical protein
MRCAGRHVIESYRNNRALSKGAHDDDNSVTHSVGSFAFDKDQPADRR